MSNKEWADGPYKLLSTPKAALNVKWPNTCNEIILKGCNRDSKDLARLEMHPKWP
jgi:hypothetical protein